MHGSGEKDSVTHGSTQRDAYDVPEVAARLGVGEAYVWTLISRNDLHSFKLGRLRKVAAVDLEAFINKLRDEEQQLRAVVGTVA